MQLSVLTGSRRGADTCISLMIHRMIPGPMLKQQWLTFFILVFCFDCCSFAVLKRNTYLLFSVKDYASVQHQTGHHNGRCLVAWKNFILRICFAVLCFVYNVRLTGTNHLGMHLWIVRQFTIFPLRFFFCHFFLFFIGIKCKQNIVNGLFGFLELHRCM